MVVVMFVVARLLWRQLLLLWLGVAEGGLVGGAHMHGAAGHTLRAAAAAAVPNVGPTLALEAPGVPAPHPSR